MTSLINAGSIVTSANLTKPNPILVAGIHADEPDGIPITANEVEEFVAEFEPRYTNNLHVHRVEIAPGTPAYDLYLFRDAVNAGSEEIIETFLEANRHIDNDVAGWVRNPEAVEAIWELQAHLESLRETAPEDVKAYLAEVDPDAYSYEQLSETVPGQVDTLNGRPRDLQTILDALEAGNTAPLDFLLKNIHYQYKVLNEGFVEALRPVLYGDNLVPGAIVSSPWRDLDLASIPEGGSFIQINAVGGLNNTQLREGSLTFMDGLTGNADGVAQPDEVLKLGINTSLHAGNQWGDTNVALTEEGLNFDTSFSNRTVRPASSGEWGFIHHLNDFLDPFASFGTWFTDANNYGVHGANIRRADRVEQVNYPPRSTSTVSESEHNFTLPTNSPEVIELLKHLSALHGLEHEGGSEE